MIDALVEESIEDFLTELEIDADDLAVGENDLEEIFDPELPLESMLSDSEFESVLAAIVRSRSDLGEASSIAELDAYVENFDADPARMGGLMNNLKGIHGELEVCGQLNASDDGLTYALAPDTNNPDVDIYGYDANHEVQRQLQVKITENPAYIEEARKTLPDNVELISGTEMAEAFPGYVVEVGLSSQEIGADVRAAIEILMTEDPIFDELATDVPFGEYVRVKGIAFA